MKNAIEYEYPKDARVIISQLNSGYSTKNDP